jgi:hypothetical protein
MSIGVRTLFRQLLPSSFESNISLYGHFVLYALKALQIYLN